MPITKKKIGPGLKMILKQMLTPAEIELLQYHNPNLGGLEYQ